MPQEKCRFTDANSGRCANIDSTFLTFAFTTMPGATRVVTTLMLKLDRVMTEGPREAGDTDDIVGGLLRFLPIMGRKPSPKWDEGVLAPMGGENNVARVVLKHLDFHILHPKRDIYRLFRIAWGISLVTHLSNCTPICHAFIAQNSIRALVNAMDSISPLPTHRDSLEYSTHCVSLGSNCLRMHMFAHDGLTGIIQAFSSGVVPVLMRCAELLANDDEQYFLLLGEDLPKYIIYPSVLRTAKKSLADFDEASLRGPSNTKSTISRTAWAAYHQIVLSIEMIATIKDEGVGSGREVCANDMVSLVCCLLFFFCFCNIPHSSFLVPQT